MKNLIIGAVGPGSLHRQWTSQPQYKNFDLMLNSYDGVDRSAECDYHYMVRGFKYDFAHFIAYGPAPDGRRTHPLAYDAIMFLDDDISASTRQLAQCFDLFHEHDLWMAQPSLDPRSYYSHGICLNHPEWKLRYTNFVEVQCPMFSKEAFMKVVETFKLSPMGSGLDWTWPMLLGYPTDKIAILDAVKVIHTRPVKGDYSGYGHDDRPDYQRVYDLYHPPMWDQYTAYGAIPACVSE